MELVFFKADGLQFAEMLGDENRDERIGIEQQTLDLMDEGAYSRTTGMIMHESHFNPAFFDLSTRLAGFYQTVNTQNRDSGYTNLLD